MAYDRKPKPMNELLKEFMKRMPHRTEMKRGMVLHLWPKVVGSQINAVTKDIRFDGSKLIVKVENEVWRHELHANRFSITKKLNDRVDSKVVKELVIRT